MPELPEVERARRLVERVARDRRIVKVNCAHDSLVFSGLSATRVRQALSGRTVTRTARYGKQLWMELDHRPWPCFHLGMTGSFLTPNEAPLQLASSPGAKEHVWPPRFTKLHLILDDGGELAMTNKRRLGRIRLQEDPISELPISRLGFDPLLDLPSTQRFAELLKRRSSILKAVLLDQTFAAGVGNWIADEVLYQARLDPRRRANDLSSTEVTRLRTKLKYVVETAVATDADKDLFPKTWLFHRRWHRGRSADTIRGHRIEHVTIAGRTTAWVPTRQS